MNCTIYPSTIKKSSWTSAVQSLFSYAVMDLLILEPFYGGSHKQLIDTILSELDCKQISYDIFTLPAKKWPWKARCGALMLSEMIPEDKQYKTLFCSSDLSLSELVGIRPKLVNCKKVVYFHENQLVYPVQKNEKLDFQFGFNQVMTALAADVVLFNSHYNMDSFLQAIPSFIQKIPGFKTRNTVSKIISKCQVQYFPVNFDKIPICLSEKTTQTVRDANCWLHIVWAHRWEHDKDPDTFFDVIFELQNAGANFHVSVLGEGFTDVPEIFSTAKNKLKEGTVKNWGYLTSKEEYYSVLESCDVAVSTATHEFFGVSMMECFYSGCYPLCPNRLVYPELYPRECLYNTTRQLFKRLREFCRKPWLPGELRKKMSPNVSQYSWHSTKDTFLSIIHDDVASPVSSKKLKLDIYSKPTSLK